MHSAGAAAVEGGMAEGGGGRDGRQGQIRVTSAESGGFLSSCVVPAVILYVVLQCSRIRSWPLARSQRGLMDTPLRFVARSPKRLGRLSSVKP